MLKVQRNEKRFQPVARFCIRETMLGQRKERITPLKLNTTNLILDCEIQRTDKINIPQVKDNVIHNVRIDGQDKWPQNTATIVRKRSNNEASDDHWPKGATVKSRPTSSNINRFGDYWSSTPVKSRPTSASKVKNAPKNMAYMSKCGNISTDLRRRIRPATAQVFSRRLGSKRGQTCYSESGRRLSHSAGLVRMKERIGAAGVQTKTQRPRSSYEETKDAWSSNSMLKENRMLSNVEEDNNIVVSDINHKNAIQTPETHHFENDKKRNKEKDEISDIADDSIETKHFTAAEQRLKERDGNRNFREQMAGQMSTSVTSFLRGDTILFRNVSRERLKSGKRRQRNRQLRIDNPDEIPRTEESEVEYIDRSVRKITGLFRKSAIFVCSILRLQWRMTALSADVMSRSATEEQWHAVNTSRQVKDLVFNKDLFAKSKAISRVPVWARVILDKSPDERTERDLKRLHALLRGLKSFDKFTEKIQFAMCRSFTYQWATSGRIILRQGHVGVNFYFIYSGSVFVNINDTNMYGNQFVKTEAVLKRGDSFGELALLQDIRRSATISCREDCELLVVDKDTFAKVCPQIFEEELEEKCDFLGNLGMFSPKYWTRDSLKKMCFEARIQEHKTNKVIVSDSSADEWIYICMEGKASVVRKLDLKKEIEWRKRRRRMINEVKSNLLESDDVIDMLGVLEARAYSPEVKHTKKASNSNTNVGKERLLTSMGLDYTKLKRQPANSNTDSSENGSHSSEDVPQTLTALIAREMKSNMLFLNIKTLHENDIFDICSIFGGNTPGQNRGYILASEGCKVLRIQKKSFFKEASNKAMLHAKALAELEKYPDDEKLLRNYMEHLAWITYRYSLFDRILRRKDRRTEKDIVPRKQKDSAALRVSAKENTRNVEILTALNQAFFEYDPEMRRVARWKQMQEMVAKLPQDETVEYTEILTDIRKHGTLIPEIQVNIRENIFRPKELKMAKELVNLGALDSGDDIQEHRLESISEDDGKTF